MQDHLATGAYEEFDHEAALCRRCGNEEANTVREHWDLARRLKSHEEPRNRETAYEFLRSLSLALRGIAEANLRRLLEAADE